VIAPDSVILANARPRSITGSAWLLGVPSAHLPTRLEVFSNIWNTDLTWRGVFCRVPNPLRRSCEDRFRSRLGLGAQNVILTPNSICRGALFAYVPELARTRSGATCRKWSSCRRTAELALFRSAARCSARRNWFCAADAGEVKALNTETFGSSLTALPIRNGQLKRRSIVFSQAVCA
jgi:hypothetical protein